MRKDSIPFDVDYILSKVPDGDYITVFGTSHTHGACRRHTADQSVDISYLLDASDVWINQVATRLGLGVFNISTPGNTNKNQVRQMIDFFSLPSDVIARCKAIIVEPRVQDPHGRLGIDLIQSMDISDVLLYSPIINSTALTVLPDSRQTWADRLFMTFVSPISVSKTPDEYAAEEVSRHSHDKYACPSAVKLVSDYMDVYTRTHAISMSHVIDNFDDIRTMKALSDLAKIPFAWFCWDSIDVLSDSDYDTCEVIFAKTSSIFDARIDQFKRGSMDHYIKLYGEEALNLRRCDCGHRDESYHKWISDIVYDHLGKMDIK